VNLLSLEPFRKTISLASGRISYVDTDPSSNSPPLFFVHGLGTNLLLWRNSIELLRSHQRCIAIDLPLHGQSPGALDQNLTLSGLAIIVEEVCDLLDLSLIDLVGNDLGGAICQTFAVSRPDFVRSLILTNCDVHSNLPPDAFQETVALARQGQLWARAKPLLANVNLMRHHSEISKGYEHPETLSEELLRAYLEPVLGTQERTRVFEKYLRSVCKEDLMALESKLGQFHAPVLLVWGLEDVFFSIKWAYWLQQTFPPKCDLVKIEGAKLFFVDERAEEFAQHVIRFIGIL